MTLHSEYIPLDNGLELNFIISFNKNTTNCSTGNRMSKGYRVTVIPVRRIKGDEFSMYEIGAFTGFSDQLLDCDRQSKMRLNEAKRVLNNNIELYKKYYLTSANATNQKL